MEDKVSLERERARNTYDVIFYESLGTPPIMIAPALPVRRPGKAAGAHFKRITRRNKSV